MWRLGTAAILVAQLIIVGLMSMAPVHLAHGGAGLRVVGLIISAHVAAMYATSPLFGRLPILAVGASLLATAGIAAGMSGPHDARRLSWGLRSLGLGWSAVLVSGSAMVVDGTAPADRVRVQGRTDVLLNLSGAVGGAVASATVAVTSYGHLGIAAAAIAAILLAAIALIGQCIRRGNHPSAGQRRTEGDHWTVVSGRDGSRRHREQCAEVGRAVGRRDPVVRLVHHARGGDLVVDLDHDGRAAGAEPEADSPVRHGRERRRSG
jgi:hypothetical protein